jgi:hypothetical protein
VPHYKKLLMATSINGLLMFLLTYSMLRSADHFYANINRAHMAILTAAPMVSSCCS